MKLIIILYTGISILIDSVGSILGKQEDDKEYVDKITKIILKDDRIKKIDKFEEKSSIFSFYYVNKLSNKMNSSDYYLEKW